MQHTNPHDFAALLADDMIAARFGRPYDVTSFTAYLHHLDARVTAHLDPHLADRVIRTAGAQRRGAKLFLGQDGKTVLIALAMRDPRTGGTISARTELGTWCNLVEGGLDGAWFFNVDGKTKRAGQVRGAMPGRDRTGPNLATVARVIANAKAGQQARTHDGDPLNLCRANVYVVGHPDHPETRRRGPKTDTAAQARRAVELRAELAAKRDREGGR
ncbi:MAG: hypothetical protein AAF908_00270 [Pseudomonadota bacterium]